MQKKRNIGRKIISSETKKLKKYYYKNLFSKKKYVPIVNI